MSVVPAQSYNPISAIVNALYATEENIFISSSPRTTSAMAASSPLNKPVVDVFSDRVGVFSTKIHARIVKSRTVFVAILTQKLGNTPPSLVPATKTSQKKFVIFVSVIAFFS